MEKRETEPKPSVLRQGADRDAVSPPQSPPSELYIYALTGVLGAGDEKFLGNRFVGNWVEGDSSFLFFSAPSRKKVLDFLGTHPELDLEDEYHFSYDEWQGGGFDVQGIGPFLIVPPWVKRPPRKNGKVILLDPGVVFGNCLHPTTRDCLRAISIVARESGLGKVLDLGTGTGVLAVACALLGANSIVAVDLNPLCVKTACRNVTLNGLDRVVRVVEGKAEDFAGEPADLIVANIHYQVIRGFMDRFAFRGGTKLIVSGLMRSQRGEVIQLLQHRGFTICREWDHDATWFTLLGEPV